MPSLWRPSRDRGSGSGSAGKYHVARSWQESVQDTVAVPMRPSTAAVPAIDGPDDLRVSGTVVRSEKLAQRSEQVVPSALSRHGSRRSLGSLVHGLGSEHRAASAPARAIQGPGPVVPARVWQPLEVPPLSSAVGGPLWLNNTLAQAQDAVSTAVVDPSAARECSGARVLPMLCRELRCGTAVQQARSLDHFLRHIGAVHRCPLTAPDAAGLLSVLFVLLQRRGNGALTGLHTRAQARAAELAFRTLCALFCRPSRHSGVLLAGLQQVLDGCACTTADFAKRPELPGPPQWPPPQADESDSASSGSDHERHSQVSALREDIRRRMHAAMLRRQEALRPPDPVPPEEVPFLQTLHCVDPYLLGPGNGAIRGPLGDLTEEVFQNIHEDFDALDHDGGGTLDISELGGGRGVALISGVNIASHDFFHAVDSDGDGTITLEELLRYWYPCVPRRFIRRRVRVALEHRARRRASMNPDPPPPSDEAAPPPPSGRSVSVVGVLKAMSSASAPGRRDADASPRSEGSVRRKGSKAAVSQPRTSEQGEEDLDVRNGFVLVCDDWMEGLKERERFLASRGEEDVMMFFGQPEPVDTPDAASELAAIEDVGDDDDDDGPSPGNVANAATEDFLGIVRQAAAAEGAASASIPDALAESGEDATPPPTSAVDLMQARIAAKIASVSAVGPPRRQSVSSPLKLTRAVPWGERVAVRLKDGFDALDIDGSGEVTWKEIIMNGGSIGGMTIHRELFMKMDRDRNGQIDLIELCRELYPRVALNEIKQTVRKVENEADDRVRARQQVRRQNEQDFAAAVEQKRLDLSRTLEEVDHELTTLQQKLDDLEIDERQRSQMRLKERRARREQRQRAKDQKERQLGPCVPIVHSCTAFPEQHVVSGVKLTAPDLRLDAYLSSDATRHGAVRLLETLDASGVDIRAFTAHGHLYVPARLTHDSHVYRDFTSIRLRPRASRLSNADALRWVRFVTNIRRRSNIKFRFHFEGHNARRDRTKRMLIRQPVSTVVCGATGFPRWPDSAAAVYAGIGAEWGSNCVGVGDAVHHLGSGLTDASLGYTSDGTVMVTLAAPSLCDLALTVSASLVFHDAGSELPLAGHFVTDEEEEAQLLRVPSQP